MDNILLSAGLACVIAAVAGGGLKAFGVEVPVLTSLPRQLALGVLGLALVVFALKPAFLFGETKPMGSGPIAAALSSASPVVESGGSTEITVRATTSDGTPLADADVDIKTDGGTFQSGGTRINGRTGANGVFKALWRYSDAGAHPGNQGNVFDVTVSKDGMTAWEDRLTVRLAG